MKALRNSKERTDGLKPLKRFKGFVDKGKG